MTGGEVSDIEFGSIVERCPFGMKINLKKWQKWNLYKQKLTTKLFVSLSVRITVYNVCVCLNTSYSGHCIYYSFWYIQLYFNYSLTMIFEYKSKSKIFKGN